MKSGDRMTTDTGRTVTLTKYWPPVGILRRMGEWDWIDDEGRRGSSRPLDLFPAVPQTVRGVDGSKVGA